MSRWWGWWRPIAPRPSRRELEADLARVETERAEVVRDRNRLVGQLAAAQVAVGRKHAALLAAHQAGHDLGHKLQAAETRLERVGAALDDEGLTATDANARARQVLTEGDGDA